MVSALPKAQSLALALLLAQAMVVSRRPAASPPGSEAFMEGYGREMSWDIDIALPGLRKL